MDTCFCNNYEKREHADSLVDRHDDGEADRPSFAALKEADALWSGQGEHQPDVVRVEEAIHERALLR
jgi:hypothetical protein